MTNTITNFPYDFLCKNSQIYYSQLLNGKKVVAGLDGRICYSCLEPPHFICVRRQQIINKKQKNNLQLRKIRLKKRIVGQDIQQEFPLQISSDLPPNHTAKVFSEFGKAFSPEKLNVPQILITIKHMAKRNSSNYPSLNST